MGNFIQLLKIELQKVLPHRGFRILIILYLLSLIAAPYLMETNRYLKTLQSIFEFPFIWFFYYFSGMFVSFILAIIFITITCNEYTYGTLKQNIIDGYSRTDTILAKASVILFFSLVTTLIFAVNGLIAGFSNTMQPEAVDIFLKAGWIPSYFLHIMLIMSFGFFLSTWIRRTGFTLILFVIWLTFLEPTILALSTWKNLGIHPYLPATGVLYPLGIEVEELFKNMGPGGNSAGLLDMDSYIPDSLPIRNIILKTAYSGIFIGLSWLLVRKRDL